jgi:aldose 1-epimerase
MNNMTQTFNDLSAPNPAAGAARRGGILQRCAGQLADGSPVTEYTLDNGCGLTLVVLDLGGIVTQLLCADREGRMANVVPGLARLADYPGPARSFSSLVGRCAGRIDGGRFVLDGQHHDLTRNEGPHTLHGGHCSYGERLWRASPAVAEHEGEVALDLHLDSAHGDQGFPGRLALAVRYTLTPSGEWRIDYRATTDRATVLNPTHHAYWNLAGGGSIEQHRLTLAASRYAELDATLIPRALAPVQGTPMDFRAGRLLGEGLRVPHPQIRIAAGYDHFFEIDRSGPGLVPAARLEDPASGRVLEIETTAPGLQFYSGNALDGRLATTAGALLRQGDALCLETQAIGDAPNRSEAPAVVLRPGQVFTSTTVHRLGVCAG